MENSVGLELKTLNNRIRRYVEKNSHKEEIEQLTGTNSWILFYLAERKDKDVFQKDIEKEFHVTRSTTSIVIRLMEEKGLIKRESVAYDARLKKLVLTDKSNQILDLVRQDMVKTEKQLTLGFSEQELSELCGYLKRMKENIGE